MVLPIIGETIQNLKLL